MSRNRRGGVGRAPGALIERERGSEVMKVKEHVIGKMDEKAMQGTQKRKKLSLYTFPDDSRALR